MNYADSDPSYTRIHEPRHLHPERDYTRKKSLLFYEYSQTNPEEPYYPINDERNRELLAKYNEIAKDAKDVIIGGRLGSYAYYDMDQVIGQALSVFESQINKA